MMKKIWKDKWVKALRSGEYAQGRNFLCKEGKEYDRVCCLGVLCDIVGPGKWKYSDKGISKCEYQEPDVELPPRRVLGKVGLSPDCADHLATMNDDGKKFSTIA